MNPGSLYQIIFDSIKRKERVLDLGCANGNFSGELKKKECIVHGVEISNVMAKNARKVLDKVIIGNIETMDINLPKNSYDVILLMDVLEHLFDPKQTLIKSAPFLKDKGRMIVSIPNVANWEVRIDLLFGRFDSEKTAILEEGHIRFFTFKKACALFNSSGYRVRKYDLVINYPLTLLKIKNRLTFIDIEGFIKKYLHRFFAYQYIFILSKK
jgi:2-polyprenyl-3-methyl-5-hydroxy-6-metoxy-1,4-benzoquinol methylase